MSANMSGPIAACLASAAVLLRLLMLADHRVNTTRRAVQSIFNFNRGYYDANVTLSVMVQVVVVYLVVFSVSWFVLALIATIWRGKDR